MKKQILKSVLILAVIGSASTAMAVTSITGQVTIGSGSFSPSTKVGLAVVSVPLSYGATSCHLTGTKQYGTVAGTGVAGDPSKIYVKDIPAQSGTIGVPSTPTATDLAGGYASWQ